MDYILRGLYIGSLTADELRAGEVPTVPEYLEDTLPELQNVEILQQPVPEEKFVENLVGELLAKASFPQHVPEGFGLNGDDVRFQGSFSDFYDIYFNAKDLCFNKLNPTAAEVIMYQLEAMAPVFLTCGCNAFKYKLNLPDAVPPSKTRPSDSGYDLTLVELVDQKGPIYFYDTGVSVSPHPGTYFDLVPRSSLAKTGYVLANSVGVIDMGYTGNIIVALLKVWDEAPELELPYRAVQIIPRHINHLSAFEVDSLDSTSRAEGGFGSTDGKV